MRPPAPARWWALCGVAVLGPGCDGEATRWSQPAPEPPPVHPPPEPDPQPTAPSVDSDGDGFLDDDDCAPEDPLRYPGADERCNGLDDDCDGTPHPSTDRDDDADGYPWCTECDDTDADAFPGASDPIDGVDQDCDGTDGQGEALRDPAYAGTVYRGILGFDLAAADFDGDGCDDLVIGQPRDAPSITYLSLYPTSSVSLRLGCADGALIRFGSEDDRERRFLGTYVDIGAGLITFVDPGFNGIGRAFLFDTSFGPDAEPILEVHADGQDATDSVVLLGSPPEWMMTSGSSWNGGPQHLNLVSTARRGVIRFLDEPPDLQIWTDSYFPYSGHFLADVGDRDGDGEVDLAYGMPDPALESVYFFPQVYAAHIDDAPEVWRGEPDAHTGFGLEGDADLDGDGLDDALTWSALGHGEQPYAGVVYVTPWRGPGEHTLARDAPARVEGEFTNDGAGAGMGAADLDGDGADDLVVSAPGDWVYTIRAGKVMVFAGPLSGVYTAADADRLWVGEHLGDHAGRGLALGDFDGSGRPDIAIGAPFADGDAELDGGAVYLLYDPL